MQNRRDPILIDDYSERIETSVGLPEGEVEQLMLLSSSFTRKIKEKYSILPPKERV